MSLKFSSLVASFLKWASKCRHKTTVDVYRHYYRRFLDEVGDLDVKTLHPCDVSAWAETWHQSQAIVRLLRWAVEDAGLLKSSPLAFVKHPPKGARRRTLTKGEHRRILKSSPKDLRFLLIGFRESWARPGELRAAKLSDLYPRVTRARLTKLLVTGQATIVLFNYKNRKSRRLPNQPRVILISPTLGKLIVRRLRASKSIDERIFLTSAGRPWTANALRCRMRRLRRRLGMLPDERGENIVPYTFRHDGATRASALGIRDRILADILGHTETSTTARYQHLQTGHLRAALRKVWNHKSSR